MASARLCVFFVMVGCGILVLASVVADDAGAVPYNYDKDFLVQHPGSGAAYTVGHVHGQNITVTLWNFTQFAGRTINIGFSHSNVYDYDPEWGSGSLAYSYTFGSTGRTIELWCVMSTAGEVSISAYYSDTDVFGTFNMRIERSITTYSLDYEFRQNVTNRLDIVNENITSLNENLTRIHDETVNLTNLTLPLFNTTSHLLENVTLLWQNVSALLADVDQLQQWRASVLADLGDLGAELDRLNTSMAALEASNAGLSAQLLALLASYDSLNATLTALAADVEVLKASGVDLAWVVQNLTDIRSQVAAIGTALEAMPLLEEDVAALEASVARAAQDISNLTAQLAAVEDSVPDAYDDTALRERLAQLETLNGVLQDRLDDLEKEQQDQRDVKSPDAALVYSAFIIGMLGLVVGVAALLYKKR